ncbi:MAG: apolipoprotein N-acyltransferase, partial [Candidatus Bipolaricaulaceae bacterium]
MTGVRRVGLALVGAGLLWGSFFPGLGFLVWVALVPLFLALDGAGAKRGAGLGFLFGLVFFALEFSALASLRPFIGPMSYGVIFLLSVYGGVFLGVLGGLGGWRSSPFIWAGFWSLLEAARGSGPLGFTFGSVPTALAGSPFVAAGGVAGPWLLSLGVALTAAFLAKSFRRPKLLPLALLGPLLLWGIGQALPDPRPKGTVRLALIQADIPQADRLNRGKLLEILARYERLLAQVPNDVDLIVIPENATPAFLRIEREYLAPFARTAREKDVPLLVGTADIEGEEIRNTMLLLTPDGRESVVYAKIHLVPFGEYVPGRSLWGRLGLDAVIDQFLPYDQAPGERLEPVGIYGVVICFESAFPGPSRVLAYKGAEVLLVATNDAWFGRTRILWEHYAMGSLRGAEIGRTCIQVGQTGISGGWGAKGEELARFPVGEGVFLLEVPRFTGRTPYTVAGDVPSLILAGGLVLWGWKGARRRGPQTPKEAGFENV